MTRAAANAAATADALLAWLRTQSGSDGTAVGAESEAPEAASARGQDSRAGVSDVHTREASAAAAIAGENTGPQRLASRPEAECQAAAMRLARTDWLHHRLTMTGATDQFTTFRRAAVGAGIIPWQIDLDRMEEDVFHLLVSPTAPQLRTLSVAGARVLAGQLREAVGRRHERAVARVGVSQACPFDLHALVPVADEVLRLGPDDPAALAWLRREWVLAWRTICPRHGVRLRESGEVPVAPGWEDFFRRHTRVQQATCSGSVGTLQYELSASSPPRAGEAVQLNDRLLQIQNVMAADPTSDREAAPEDGVAFAMMVGDILWALTRSDLALPDRIAYEAFALQAFDSDWHLARRRSSVPADYTRFGVMVRHAMMASAAIIAADAKPPSPLCLPRTRSKNELAFLLSILTTPDAEELVGRSSRWPEQSQAALLGDPHRRPQPHVSADARVYYSGEISNVFRRIYSLRETHTSHYGLRFFYQHTLGRAGELFGGEKDRLATAEAAA